MCVRLITLHLSGGDEKLISSPASACSSLLSPPAGGTKTTFRSWGKRLAVEISCVPGFGCCLPVRSEVSLSGGASIVPVHLDKEQLPSVK